VLCLSGRWLRDSTRAGAGRHRVVHGAASRSGGCWNAHRSLIDLEGFEFGWAAIDHKGPFVAARLGVGHAFKQ
jgi:hypothetical protein